LPDVPFLAFFSRSGNRSASPCVPRFMSQIRVAFTISSLLLCAVAGIADTNASCSTTAVQSVANQWAAAHDFSGSVLVERNSTPLASLAFGEADREHHAPNTLDTPLRIGSITKLFTTTAILREIADAHLQRTTAICTIIKDCPAPWRAITVEQALTHTDGLPDIVRQPDFVNLLTRPTTPEETLAHLHSIPLLFAPGSDVAYGNTGMIALTVILEKLTGKSYSAAIDALVAHPAMLEHTMYDDPATILPGRARGYIKNDGVMQNASYIDMSLPSGAGGMVSTVRDLDHFVRAYLSGKIIPLDLVRESMTPKNPDYGFGWAINSVDGTREISHIGDINGFGSFLAYYPSSDVVIAVLTNVERTPVRDLGRLPAKQCTAK
jgi:CubicO group peptidase (beta-lactamase class C family)